MERLEQLRSQLSSSADLELCAQLEEVLGKLEPPDSASSSRRSSISSHVSCNQAFSSPRTHQVNLTLLHSRCFPQESFNILDCGIYRVISRRGSQSEEETGSLINHSMSEEERLKEFSFTQEEDQADHGRSPHVVAVSFRLQVFKLPYCKSSSIIHIFLCSYLFLICINLFLSVGSGTNMNNFSKNQIRVKLGQM